MDRVIYLPMQFHIEYIFTLFSSHRTAFSRMSCKWNHKAYGIFNWLFSLSSMCLSLINVVWANISFLYSFLSLNSIALYVCTTVCLSIHQRRTSWLPLLLAIMDKTSINFCVGFSWTHIFNSVEAQLLNCMVRLCLVL